VRRSQPTRQHSASRCQEAYTGLAVTAYMVLAGLTPLLNHAGVSRPLLLLLASVLLATVLFLPPARGISASRLGLLVPLLLWLMWTGATIWWSQDQSASVEALMRVVGLSAPIVLLALARGTRSRAPIAAFALSVVGSLVFLQPSFTGILGTDSRLALTAEANPTALAAHLASAFICAIFLLLTSRSRGPRTFWVGVAGFAALALVLTQGRNSAIALGVSAVIAGAYIAIRLAVGSARSPSDYRTAVASATIGTVVLLALVSIVTFGDTIGLNRFALLADGDVRDATAGRSVIWRAYGATLQQRPLVHLAVGSGAGTAAVRPLEHDHAPHQAVLLSVFETGLIGAALWAFALLGLAIQLRTSQATIATASAALWFFLFGLMLGAGNDVQYYTYFWDAIALSVIASKLYVPAKVGASPHAFATKARGPRVSAHVHTS
jgi:O-antigen ligase